VVGVVDREGGKTARQTPGRTCEWTNGQTDMPEWVKPPLQVNAKCDVVMKLSLFGTRTDTHTHISQNLYIQAMRAVKIWGLCGYGSPKIIGNIAI